jgi:hypothetical protein
MNSDDILILLIRFFKRPAISMAGIILRSTRLLLYNVANSSEKIKLITNHLSKINQHETNRIVI